MALLSFPLGFLKRPAAVQVMSGAFVQARRTSARGDVFQAPKRKSRQDNVGLRRGRVLFITSRVEETIATAAKREIKKGIREKDG